MGGVAVSSEIGRLKRVIVHTPGAELLAVTPSTRREYLYDDIIDLEGAAEEHRRFVSILRRFADVVQLRDILTETLRSQAARDFLVTRSEEVTANRSLHQALRHWDPETMVTRYIEGWEQPAGPFTEKLDEPVYVLPPLPNLFFTRDASVVIGDQVVIAAMRYQTRWPEEALMRTIFGFHPIFAGTNILYDGSDERRSEYVIEGGDVHPLREDLLLVGISERTKPAVLDLLCEILFERTKIQDVIAVVLPEKSTAIHLDMVWTQVDRELCVAHPPFFRGPTRAPILHRHKGQVTLSEPPTLFAALQEVGMRMEPVWAGGSRWETQEREQWASGCNFFAVAPGQVLSYSRNEQTLRALEQAGFKHVDGKSMLLGDDDVQPGERAVITFPGAELVRGGGGPRCMTCPVEREPL